MSKTSDRVNQAALGVMLLSYHIESVSGGQWAREYICPCGIREERENYGLYFGRVLCYCYQSIKSLVLPVDPGWLECTPPGASKSLTKGLRRTVAEGGDSVFCLVNLLQQALNVNMKKGELEREE